MEMRKEEVEGKHFPFKNLMGKLHTFLLTLPQWSELGCIHPNLGRRLGYIVPTIRNYINYIIYPCGLNHLWYVFSTSNQFSDSPDTHWMFDPDNNYLKLTQTQNLRAPSHKTLCPIALKKHHKSWASCTSGQLVVNWEFPHPLLRFDDLVKELKELGTHFTSTY